MSPERRVERLYRVEVQLPAGRTWYYASAWSAEEAAEEAEHDPKWAPGSVPAWAPGGATALRVLHQGDVVWSRPRDADPLDRPRAVPDTRP